MQIGIKTIRMVRVEASEAEWDSLRRLVAEGLSVVETITPDMAYVADALGLQVRSDDGGAPQSVSEEDGGSTPAAALPSPRKSRPRKEREPYGDGSVSV